MSDQQQGYNYNQYQGQGYQYNPNQQSYNPGQSYQYNPDQQAYNPNQQYSQYGQQQGGYQGYQQGGYQGYQGYQQGGYQGYQQNYGGYQGYQQGYQQDYQQPQQSQGMSLEEYKKQAAEAAAAAPKPKKKLTFAPSSSIKLGGAKKEEPKKEEPKKEEPKKEETKKEETKKEEPKKEEEKKEELPKVEQLKISEPKEASPAPKASTPAPSGADIVIKQQEEDIDEEVVNDMFGGKDHVSIIFMGHVDAGKSTMGGNLLYLTGSVDKRTVEKYEREAKDAGRQGWYLSWVMDTNKEERNDGKTIEVGKAYFETEKRRYTILDAPGHKMYVSEMIGGASQADVGVLVISARKGEYETGFEKGGQTREHALLAKTQGVNKMVVVVNKMDDPTVEWSQDRFNECTNKVGQFLKGIGYTKNDVIFMPVSGYTGAGLKDRVNPADCPWYTGPSLLEYLDNMKHLDRHINAPFMLPVTSKMKDLGTVIEGKIESGHVKKGSQLIMMPNKVNVEVLSIFNETEAEVDVAVCGEQVRLKLKGIEEEDIAAGYVLSSPAKPVHTVTRFAAEIAIVELKSILSNGFACVMHVHTAIEEVTITQLLHKLEKGTNRRSKRAPAYAKQGMKIVAILETTEPVCVETYQDYQQLGRFTLRDQGQTIAIGKIIKLLE